MDAQQSVQILDVLYGMRMMRDELGSHAPRCRLFVDLLALGLEEDQSTTEAQRPKDLPLAEAEGVRVLEEVRLARRHTVPRLEPANAVHEPSVGHDYALWLSRRARGEEAVHRRRTRSGRSGSHREGLQHLTDSSATAIASVAAIAR